MRFDSKGAINFASAQSALGQALYAKFGQQSDETYMLVDKGRAHVKSSGYFVLVEILGGVWRVFKIFGLIPRPLRDWLYDRVARNRYRWFGKAGYCALLTEEQRKRLL